MSTFKDVADYKVLLLTEIYNNPSVINDLCNLIRDNTLSFSNILFNERTSSIQIQLKKSFLKKSNLTTQDSYNLYGIFDDILFTLLCNCREQILSSIGKIDNGMTNDDKYNDMLANVRMLYNITTLPNNVVMLYL